MSNTFNSDTKDFQFVVNKALLEVTPIRLRGKIAENLLGYYNELRQEINKLKQNKVDMLEKLRERLNDKTELIEFSDYYSQSVITTYNVCETINEMIIEISKEN